MIRNTPERVRSVLGIYAENDDLQLEWTSGSSGSPIHDDYPAELKIKNADGVQVASLFCFENGFDTVLEAVGTTLEALQQEYSVLGTRKPHRMRIRRTGTTFKVMSAF